MIADILTKGLHAEQFTKLREMAGLKEYDPSVKDRHLVSYILYFKLVTSACVVYSLVVVYLYA